MIWWHAAMNQAKRMRPVDPDDLAFVAASQAPWLGTSASVEPKLFQRQGSS